MANEILVMRAAIVERLREVLPGVDVQEHPRVDVDVRDIARMVQTQRNKLALRVAFTGIKGAQYVAFEADAPCGWAVYIAAADIPSQATRPAISRDVAILALLPTVIATIVADNFDIGETEARKPVGVDSGQIYEGEAEASVASAAVWAVTWQQTVIFTPPADDDIRPLLSLITSYDIAPADEVIDASDTIEFEQE